MIRNYLRLAFRHLIKSPLFSFIHIAGMVLGITCSTLILLYAWSELQYDRFHTHAENIYRITTQAWSDQTIGAVTPGMLAPELKNNFPEIKHIARVGKWSGVLKTNEHLFEEGDIYFTDHSLIEMFDFPLIRGNQTSVLKEPNHLLITESMAVKYFGADWKTRSDVIGTIFRLNNADDFTLAGILKDPPAQSSFQFKFLLPLEHLMKDKWSYNWGSYNFITFIELNPDHSIALFNQKIKDSLRKQNAEAGFDLSTQPLTDIYLNPLAYDYWSLRGNYFYIKIFVVIGLGILLIACFNFINLSTAQSAKRSKEVGIRKTIGATRFQIFKQFIGESLLVILLSVLISRGLLDLLVPYFNFLSGKELFIEQIHIVFFVGLIASMIFVGFLASLYPATILSSFQASKVLKGITTKSHGKRFREVLVVAQFSMAVLLLIGTVVIYQQLEYMQTRDLGFNKEQLLYIRLNGPLKQNEDLLRNELLQQPEVIGAAASTSTLVNNDNYTSLTWQGQPEGKEVRITQMNADPYLIPLLDMKILYGKNFSVSIPGDSSFIINETAAKEMGLSTDEALGKEVSFWGMKGKVIGIVKDFHFRPLQTAIEPFIMRYQKETNYFTMLVKVKTGKAKDFVEKIPALYQKVDAENPVNYGFVDDRLNQLYQSDQRAGMIMLNFSIISIFITCLGLLGLSAYLAEQRTKEIGIRKVLGASVTGIIQLLSIDLVRLMLISIGLSLPLAWYLMKQWLKGFAYQTPIQWWVVSGALFFAVSIAFFTIGTQVIKAAMANPVDSLKSE
jgi:putative ABC transport system permease protein